MIKIERSFLGSCLEEPERIGLVDLSPNEFSDPTLASIWKAIQSGETDVASLSKFFDGKIDGVLSDIVMEAHGYAFDKHLLKIKSEAQTRIFIKSLKDGLMEIERGTSVSTVASQIAERAVSTGGNGFVYAGEIITDVYSELTSDEPCQRFIPTGFSSLDFVIGGLERSGLVVIAARPSQGKTAIAMNMCLHMAKEHSVCFSSIEMDSSSMGYRLLSATSRMDLRLLRTNSIKSKEAWKKTYNGVEEINKLKLYIDDTPRISAERIAAQCRKQKLKHGLDVLMVDYIGLLSSDDKRKKRHEQVAEATRTFKLLAKELDCCVVLLCQLNRDAEGQRPLLSMLRESGSIEQDADVVLFPYREDKESNNAELIIGKQRNGPTTSIQLEWDGPTASFRE